MTYLLLKFAWFDGDSTKESPKCVNVFNLMCTWETIFPSLLKTRWGHCNKFGPLHVSKLCHFDWKVKDSVGGE